jgi:uncharacterized protein (TIGR03032 family)
MDRISSTSSLLDPLVPQWQELLQRWTLDGSISSSAQEALHKDAQSPQLAVPATWLVARPFVPEHTTNWFTDAARQICSRTWFKDREHGLSELCQPQRDPERQPVDVRYEHSQSLPALLEQLKLSVLLSTYQAGRVVSLGSQIGELRLGFCRFDQAMGLTRTASGIAVCSRDAIWSLPVSREIAPRIKPEGEHDIAFLARNCHHSGSLMGHDLAWGNGRLWLVNSLFSGLMTIENHCGLMPQWQPRFIWGFAAGDCCNLNGLALAAEGSSPTSVTAKRETNAKKGWREQKTKGGCLFYVPSGEVVLRGLAMLHSPRLNQCRHFLLKSGHGAVVQVEHMLWQCRTVMVVMLQGITRQLDLLPGYDFVAPSKIQETEDFGGLAIWKLPQYLLSELASVKLFACTVRELLCYQRGLKNHYVASMMPSSLIHELNQSGIPRESAQTTCLGLPIASV